VQNKKLPIKAVLFYEYEDFTVIPTATDYNFFTFKGF
jgi:hypothetical protein